MVHLYLCFLLFCVSVIPALSNAEVTEYVTGHPGNCWFHKFYYVSGNFTDVFVLKDHDMDIVTDFACADGCIYTKLGEPFTTEYCFENSPDPSDEALSEYIIPTCSD